MFWYCVRARSSYFFIYNNVQRQLNFDFEIFLKSSWNLEALLLKCYSSNITLKTSLLENQYWKFQLYRTSRIMKMNCYFYKCRHINMFYINIVFSILMISWIFNICINCCPKMKFHLKKKKLRLSVIVVSNLLYVCKSKWNKLILFAHCVLSRSSYLLYA